jgi:hypothetical protein
MVELMKMHDNKIKEYNLMEIQYACEIWLINNYSTTQLT